MKNEFYREKFIDILLATKLSPKQLADISGVKQTTIEKWIYCGAQPTLENALTVLDALGAKLYLKGDGR